MGLKSHPRLRDKLISALEDGIDVGSGGSRLLRGNHEAIEALETKAASFFGAERTLFMATGYLANFTIFATLPQRRDAIIFDELMHASGKEGIRASLAKSGKARHNDPQSFEDEVKRWRAAGKDNIWIVVESVYSMDGDFAPLDALMDIADRHGCYLVVDEAHGTAVHGPNGRGLAAAYEGRENLISLHTCGKGLGAAGALVTVPALLADYMVNCARSFIFTTAPSPLMAVAIAEAISVLEDEPQRIYDLKERIAFAHDRLQRIDGTDRTLSQILPVIVGADGDAVSLANHLQNNGFDVRAIRPPTVPEGSARLRISITLNASKDDFGAMLDCLQAAWEVKNS